MAAGRTPGSTTELPVGCSIARHVAVEVQVDTGGGRAGEAVDQTQKICRPTRCSS